MKRIIHRTTFQLGSPTPLQDHVRLCTTKATSFRRPSRDFQADPLTPGEEIASKISTFKKEHKVFRRKEQRADALKYIRQLPVTDANSTWMEERSAASLLGFCAYFKVSPNLMVQTKMSLAWLLERSEGGDLTAECASTMIASLIQLDIMSRTSARRGGEPLEAPVEDVIGVCHRLFQDSVLPHLGILNFKAFSVALTCLGTLTAHATALKSDLQLAVLWEAADGCLARQLEQFDGCDDPAVVADPLVSIGKALSVHHPESANFAAVFCSLRLVSKNLYGYQMGSILTSVSRLASTPQHREKIDTVLVSLVVDRLQHELSHCAASDLASCLWGLSRLVHLSASDKTGEWDGIDTEILLLFEVAEQEIHRKMKLMKTQERIMVFQAFLDATGSLSQELVMKMKMIVVHKLETLSQGEVAQILGILWKSRNVDNELLSGISAVLPPLIARMSPKQIANTLAAFATVPRGWNSGAFRNIFAAAQKRLTERELMADRNTIASLIFSTTAFCAEGSGPEFEATGIPQLIETLCIRLQQGINGASTGVLIDLVLRLPAECFASVPSSEIAFTSLRKEAETVLCTRLSSETFNSWSLFDASRNSPILTAPSPVTRAALGMLQNFAVRVDNLPQLSPEDVRGLFGTLDVLQCNSGEDVGESIEAVLANAAINNIHFSSNASFTNLVSVVQITMPHLGGYDSFREAVDFAVQRVFRSSVLRMHHSDVVLLFTAVKDDQWLFGQLIETFSSSAKLENLHFELVDWRRALTAVEAAVEHRVDRHQFLPVFFPLAQSASTQFCQDCNGIIRLATAVARIVPDKAPLLTNQCSLLLQEASGEEIVQLMKLTSVGAEVSYSRKLSKRFAREVERGTISGKQLVELATIVASPSLKRLLQKSLEEAKLEAWDELVTSRSLPPEVIKTICTRERFEALGEVNVERQLHVALVCAEAITPLPNMIRGAVNPTTMSTLLNMCTPKNASSIILLTPENANVVASHLVTQRDPSVFRHIPLVDMRVILSSLSERKEKLQLIRYFSKKVDAATFADVADSICVLLTDIASLSGAAEEEVGVVDQIFEVLVVTATRLLRGANSNDIARVINTLNGEKLRRLDSGKKPLSTTVRPFLSRVDLRICDEARRFSAQQVQEIAEALENFDCISPTLRAIAAGDITPEDDHDDESDVAGSTGLKLRPKREESILSTPVEHEVPKEKEVLDARSQEAVAGADAPTTKKKGSRFQRRPAS